MYRKYLFCISLKEKKQLEILQKETSGIRKKKS